MYNAEALSFPTLLLAKPLSFSPAPFLEFEVDGATESARIKQFSTDDGERLRELLSKGGQELGKLGRQVAQQTAAVSRTAADMVRQGSAPARSTEQVLAAPPSAPQTSITFFYLDASGTPRGPVSHAALLGLMASGEVTRDTMIIEHGASEWTTAATLLPQSTVN